MLENAVYSILSPEGYASILWKDSSRAQEAAEKMKLTADDLYDLNVIDKVIKESDLFEQISENLRSEIVNITQELNKLTEEQLVEQRYQKFRQMGDYKKYREDL